MRYFEDVHVGEHATLGSHTITRDEILAFARQFDPQPFHMDEEWARERVRRADRQRLAHGLLDDAAGCGRLGQPHRGHGLARRG
jgi:acyl dehydratase